MKHYLTKTIATVAILPASIGHAEIVIQNTQALAFGSFVAGSGGTVTVDVNDARASAGDVMLMPSSRGQAAQFTVTGSAGATYTIELPPNDFVKLSAAGAGDMVVNDFTSSPSGAGGQLDGGSQALSVGATLAVGSGQMPATYSGNFTVIVSYN